MVDIDPHELSKFTPNDFHLDLGIESDFHLFFQSLFTKSMDLICRSFCWYLAFPDKDLGKRNILFVPRKSTSVMIMWTAMFLLK